VWHLREGHEPVPLVTDLSLSAPVTGIASTGKSVLVATRNSDDRSVGVEEVAL
jgi:hypothetical protein